VINAFFMLRLHGVELFFLFYQACQWVIITERKSVSLWQAAWRAISFQLPFK
jgi:hypothetical protein